MRNEMNKCKGSGHTGHYMGELAERKLKAAGCDEDVVGDHVVEAPLVRALLAYCVIHW